MVDQSNPIRITISGEVRKMRWVRIKRLLQERRNCDVIDVLMRVFEEKNKMKFFEVMSLDPKDNKENKNKNEC